MIDAVEVADEEAFDDEDMVPLGAMLDQMDKQRGAMAAEAATTQLRTAGRSPPASMDAERAVLGALLLHPPAFDTVLEAGLRPEHFYRPANATIFRAIGNLRARGEPIDTLTVVDDLQRVGRLDDVGGAASVSQLEALLPTSAHVASYARLVREKAMLRGVIDLSTKAVQSAYAQDRSPVELVEEIRTGLNRMEAQGAAGVRANSEVVASMAKQIPALGGIRRSVPTGWKMLDGVLGGGWSPGGLHIIAARPSMGKSQFVLDFACDLAVHRRQPVLFASLEMPAEDLMERLAGALSGVDTRKVRFTATEASEIGLAAGKLAASPLRIDDAATQSVQHIRSRARRIAADEGLSAIVVDYLQLLSDGGSGRRQDDVNQATRIGEMSKGLKHLARELDVPVLALSQLNRSVEQRPNKRPMMSDLRESGAIEQDADTITFLYREEYYLREACPDEKVGVAEVIIAKQRNGPAGVTVPMRFDGTPPRFC